MAEDLTAGYLAGLSAPEREALEQVNDAGLARLREYLALGEAVAFLGAGVSAPLYPLWDGLIGELVEAASGRLTDHEAATCRALATESPEEVVEIVRQQLGTFRYQEVLREVLRVRTDPQSGRSWTPVQELVCRCPFKAVVTTNYDPGIVDARMRVRAGVSTTGFMTWEDELGLDRWRTGDVFGEAELPVLFAHGQHNRPDSVVLATTEYRRAYAGKLPQVLARLVEGHLVWIGFSFADQRIAAILREIANKTGTRVDPGLPPRHVAVMAWDPAVGGNAPQILARRAEIAYGAQVVLYPAPRGDHSALQLLLSALTDHRFAPAGDLPTRGAAPVNVSGMDATAGGRGIPVGWVPEAERVEHFTGRAEELARLDRWAADPQVALVGVSAWGGAGKTALVTHWLQEADGLARSGLRGVFGWSFYADSSAEHWAARLLEWARQELGVQAISADRLAVAVLGLLRAVPLLLVLDGLEVVQQGPAGAGFGLLLDGTLREVLAGACQLRSGGLVVLTSRFPFADLEAFDGDSARMLEVPPLTPPEGSALLAATGGDWLADADRRALVQAVDGHALATAVLAGLLAGRPPASDLDALRGELAAAAWTSARVRRVLEFYAGRLGEQDRYLLAAVSLFVRAVPAAAVLTVAGHEAFAGRLAGWTPAMVQAAVRDRLGGLATWHPDGTISAHPLVRDTFRPPVMAAAEIAAETALTGLPRGVVTSRAGLLLVVEVIELLLDAGQWQPADDMYERRGGHPGTWHTLPAYRLGQRAATAFVATPARRDACAAHLGHRLGAYLIFAGGFAMNGGDLVTAQQYLQLAVRHNRHVGGMVNLSSSLYILSQCLGYLGETGPALDAAAEALTCAQRSDDQRRICYSHAHLGLLAALTGETVRAGQQFTAADQIWLAFQGDHMSGIAGRWWADWLARTGRPGPARALLENDWDDPASECARLLGRLALAAGDTTAAGEYLAAAAAGFRDGDALPGLAIALADLAEHARVIGDLDAAERHVAESIAIAAPRRLVAVQSAALAARTRIHADQAVIADSTNHLAKGRDAADAALRLATRHRLAWCELDALRAHAVLDQAQGADHGRAAQADALHAQLVPPDLDPDPLATAEQLAEEEVDGTDEDTSDS